jgi:hypothetical protein
MASLERFRCDSNPSKEDVARKRQHDYVKSNENRTHQSYSLSHNTLTYQHSDANITLHGFDQDLEDIVVYNLASSLEIDWDQCFIKSIGLVT